MICPLNAPRWSPSFHGERCNKLVNDTTRCGLAMEAHADLILYGLEWHAHDPLPLCPEDGLPIYHAWPSVIDPYPKASTANEVAP